MIRCDLIAPLLPRVADGDAEPLEAACVARHIEGCSCCGIRLARERRLGLALETIRDVEVNELFTASVMRRLPAKFPRRRRDRRGLRLAVIGGWVALTAALGGASQMGWEVGIPSAARPSLPPDVVEPAAGGLISFAEMVLLALQSVAEAPLIGSAPGLTALVVLVALCSVLAATAFGSTIVAYYALGTTEPEN